ncbi:MAG: hypothetical protein RJA22_1957 [Verrucomicrobiota bacterium]|jgi:hypothetical protein
MAKTLLQFLASLRLTVVLLALSLVVVFLGTVAQEPLGLYLSQKRFFHSFFIDWLAMKAALVKTLQMVSIHLPPVPAAEVVHGPRVPVFPGGYLLGTLLLASLVAGHFTRFKFTWKKLGIWLTHLGLILLLLGQLLTDLLATESAMRLAEGDTLNYSQDFRDNELVLIDESDPVNDRVVSIPEARLAAGRELRPPELPVTLRVVEYWRNAMVYEGPASNAVPVRATRGIGPGLHVQPLAPVTAMDERNTPSAVVEVIGPQGSLGTWLVSTLSGARQEFTVNGKPFSIALRFTRYYKDFSLRLLEFRHEKYRGTQTPKDFRSRVIVDQPSTRERREVDIYMNNPLRYGGYTFYQSSFDPRNDELVNKVTILQVVRNPGWLTPYLACGVMTLGLMVQFLMHLVGFAWKRVAA